MAPQAPASAAASSDWVDDLLKKSPNTGTSAAPTTDWVDELLNKPAAPEPSFWEKTKSALFGPTTAIGATPDASEESFRRAASGAAVTGSKIGPDGVPVPTTRTRGPNLLSPSPAPVPEMEKPLVDASQFVPSTSPKLKATAEVASSLSSPSNLPLMEATGALGAFSKVGAGIVPRAVSGAFGLQQFASIPEELEAAKRAEQAGNTDEATRLRTHAFYSGLFGLLGARHAALGDRAPVSTKSEVKSDVAASSSSQPALPAPADAPKGLLPERRQSHPEAVTLLPETLGRAEDVQPKPPLLPEFAESQKGPRSADVGAEQEPFYNKPDPRRLQRELGSAANTLPSNITEPVSRGGAADVDAVRRAQQLPPGLRNVVPNRLLGLPDELPQQDPIDSQVQRAMDIANKAREAGDVEKANKARDLAEDILGDRARLLPDLELTGLPKELPQAAAPETQQPKSDLSAVDRSKVQGGAVVDPRALDIDFDSHPFMLPDDVEKAKKRAANGEELSAIVHTDPETGRKEVVDGHGSAGAALETGTPIRAIEAANIQGEGEAIGARVASHYTPGGNKPNVTAAFGDDVNKPAPVAGQDSPGLQRIHESLRNSTAPVASDPASEIAKLHVQNGGSTYNLQQGDLNGKDLYSVGAHPDRTMTLDHTPSPAEIKNYIDLNKDVLSRPDRSIGTWDAKDGRHVLDVVATVPDQGAAMRIATEGRSKPEEAIYHLGGKGEIPVTAPVTAPSVGPQRSPAASGRDWVDDLLQPEPQTATGGARDRAGSTSTATAVLEPEDESVRPNASGESSASLEAIRRGQSEAAAGATRWRVDTRSGREFPLTGVDAVDTKPGPYDIITMRDASGRETVLDRGAKAFEKRPRQTGFNWGRERGSATPDFLAFLSTGGLSEVGRRLVDSLRKKSDVEGWPEIARFLSPADRNAASKKLQSLVVETVRSLGDPTSIEEAAKAGSSARGWYRRTAALTQFIFGKDADRFTNFVASLSPMKSVEQNFTDALNFYADWVRAGRPLGRENAAKIRSILPTDVGVAGSVIRQQLYNQLVNGAEPTGPKVSNFAKNLKGEMQAITKDRWIAYLFGQNEKFFDTHGAPRSKGTLAADAIIRSVGKKLNMLPAEVQESGWSFLRTVINLSEEKGVSPSEAARSVTETDIRAGTSEFTSLIAKDPKVRAALDALADATGNERFRVSRIERARRFQQLVQQSERTRGVAGGLGGADRDVLANVAERAAAARSGVEVQEPTDPSTEISNKLVERYGTTDDPLKAGFILNDGRMVPLSQEHDIMINSAEGKTGGFGPPRREDFINSENAVRTRFRAGKAGQEVVFSVPEGGVSDSQLQQMRASIGKMGRYGNMVMEVANSEKSKSVQKEFALPSDVDAAARKLGVHPNKSSLVSEATSGARTNANPIDLVGKLYTDLVGKRITSSLNDLYNAALGRIDLATGLPLKRTLRSPESFLPKEYLKSKTDAEATTEAGAREGLKLGKRLSDKLNQATQQTLMDIVAGRATVSQLAQARLSPRLQDAVDAAKTARIRLNDLGAQAVMQDLLKAQDFFKNYGKYVPRLYRDHEVDYNALLNSFGERKPNRMELDRFRQRKDIPPLVRAAMGEITEAAYPVARGIADLTHDVALSKLFERVSTNPSWASDTPRAGWIKMPKTFKLGKLSGKFVDRDIARDVNELIQTRSEAGKFIGELMGKYKRVRVVWAPASFVWHNLSRTVLNYLDGLPPYRVDIYSKALIDRAKEGPLYQRALKAGVIHQQGLDPETFNDLIDSWNKSNGSLTQRMMRMGADLMSTLKKGKDYQGDFWNHPYWTAAREFQPLRAATGGASDKVAGLYSALDDWMKMAKFSHNLEKGMSDYDAGVDARKATIDYRNVPKLVDWGRRTITPFITFPSQALPRLAKSAVEAPWRLLILYYLMNSFQQSSREQLGLSKDEEDKQRRLSQPRGAAGSGLNESVGGFSRYVLLPNRDKSGRLQFLDMNHLLHWTGVGAPAAPGMLPFGSDKLTGPLSLPGEIAEREIYGHPLASLGEVAFNKDPYTGKALYGPGEKHEGPGGALGERLWRSWSPSFAPGNVGFDKVRDAIQGRPDYFGRPADPSTTIGSFLTGLNVRPLDTNTEAFYRNEEFKKDMEDIRKGMYRLQADQRLDKDERDARMLELEARQQQLIERYRRLYSGSN